ncbi:MAG: DNA primase [Candidatus Auribacterota bacterium]
MNGSFSKQDLDAIRDRIDVVELIDSYVPLKKSGSNYKACCPFHQEKTPSFMVNPQKQIYHCFGCQKGGDIFSFVMDYENLTFPEAIQRLADKCGYQLTQESGPDAPRGPGKSQKDRLYACMNQAADIFSDMLLNQPLGKTAREYLQRRGLSAQTIKSWRLGYAPTGSQQFVAAMRKAGFSEKEMIQTGLLISIPDRKTTRTRFFNRIMFPIWDDQNHIVSFGGRVMDNSEPKYLNCSETVLYNKSSILYGFSAARQTVRTGQPLIVVEGYFDVIQLHQAGITGAVAPCGTALTDNQIAKLKRYSDTVYLAFDSDAAGINASLRKMDSFLDHSINTQIITLPSGEDPDSFVRKHGADAFNALLTKSTPAFDFRLASFTTRYGKDHEFNRMKIASEMLALVARQKNSLLADSWLQILHSELGFSPEVLLNELRNHQNRTHRQTVRQEKQSALEPAETEIIPVWEKEILRLILIHHADLLEKAKKILINNCFSSTIIRSIWDIIFSFNAANSHKSLSEFVLDELRGNKETCSLITELVSFNISEENIELIFNDAVKRLQKEHLEKTIQKLTASLNKASEEEKFFILKQINELNKERANLNERQ